MPIENQNPVTKPAAAESTLDKLWLVGQSSLAEQVGGAVRIAGEFIPYNSDGESDPTRRVKFNDPDAFTIHDRRPHIESAIAAKLAEFGITAPEGIPATLYLLELYAQSLGAAAQVVEAEPAPEVDPIME